MKLVSPSNAEKQVGWITSATHSERIGKEIALGYAKRGFNNAGTKLSAVTAGDPASEASQSIRVEVVPLPFL
jgi:glycine cleavage system aminomethyltransferase T